ncbi:MAG TPA: energy transducer TonB [Candidatus Eremiobacteraceae bacterium]|nr:energy transducer TonB [Candidatus Eremiobacteraceae bacterium]
MQPDVADDGVLVPPKLVKAIKSLSPPEALRGFVSGKVTLDAVVDETGHVKSATPISGPKALYEKAVETVMQYEYLPATRGGKPVPSHVQVSIQFWYEP